MPFKREKKEETTAEKLSEAAQEAGKKRSFSAFDLIDFDGKKKKTNDDN